MVDFTMKELGASWIAGIVWQSGSLLLLGLAASAVSRRRPARAHRVLLLAMVGAIVAPLGNQVARLQGWGLWTTAPADEPRPQGLPMAVVASTAVPSFTAYRHAVPGPGRRLEKPSASTPAPVPAATERPAAPARVSISISSVLGGLWCLLSALCLARLAAATIAGRRLVARAGPVASEELTHAARAAATHLGLSDHPDLRASRHVRCPVIWCWGRRPIILLPETTAPTSAVDWTGVFCHELAHRVRKDHWSGLFADVLTCLLPWNPLAWWARNRLHQLSELACDDWALSTGVPAGDYAEALLSLVPQRRTVLALSAVSSRRGLVGRVRHILHERRIVPTVGRRWSFASAAIVALAVSAIALAQTRPAESEDEGLQVDPAAARHAPAKPKAPRRVIRGQVLQADGRPAAGARVLWLGQRKGQLPPSALPRSQRAALKAYDETLADVVTDTQGRFALPVDVDPDQYLHEEGFAVNLIVASPGAGLLSSNVKDDANDVALRLPAQVIVRGRLLTPSGRPAAGVRVSLGQILDGERISMGWNRDIPDDQLPGCWPRPRTTDADGRFTIEGVPEGTCAQIEFQYPDYAIDEVTVNAVTRGAMKATLSAWIKGFEIVPVKPDFTHTLEPARPVQGRVTDKATSKPLAGVLVEMIPMRRHGGMPFYTRTDADGRYRVSGHQAENYGTQVYPAPESGYLPLRNSHQGWPAGARFLEKNFALIRGKVVHGKVLEAGTKKPVAGAAVVYQPKGNNRANDREYQFDDPVLTDADGRFAITTLPGAGILAVETTDESYMRSLVKDDGTYGHTFPQGVASIDVPRDGAPPPAEILLRKGAALEARVLDPDGKPARGVIATCEGIDARLMDVWNYGQPFGNGVFRMPGADPSRTYRVYFLHPDRKLGTFVDLKPNHAGGQPVEVRLRPTAKVHGKLVTSSGSPLQGGQVVPAIIADGKPAKMSRDELLMKADQMPYFSLVGQQAMMTYWERLRPNARGEFAIDTLLPGIGLYVMAGAGRHEAMVPVPPLKPGEDRDLGTITAKEVKR